MDSSESQEGSEKRNLLSFKSSKVPITPLYPAGFPEVMWICCAVVFNSSKVSKYTTYFYCGVLKISFKRPQILFYAFFDIFLGLLDTLDNGGTATLSQDKAK